MLNSTYNMTVEAGEIKPHSILRVSRCNVTEYRSKFFAVLIEVEVVSQPNDKIGDPVKWEPDMTYTPPGGAANRINAAAPPTVAPPARNGDYGPSQAVNNTDVKPPKPPQQQQQRPLFKNNNSSSNINSSVNTSATQTNVQSISGLNPYQNKWVIKGRVIQKSDKRSWKNARGEGTLFSFEIQDDTATLKVTAFKEECEKFYGIIEEGTVVLISKGALKPKDTRLGLAILLSFRNCARDREIERLGRGMATMVPPAITRDARVILRPRLSLAYYLTGTTKRRRSTN